MNFLKRVLGSSPKQEVALIPSGRLYLSRSQNSVKGYSECIFKDAVAVIRRTTTEYHYQLVIQRAYEEGEEQLEDDTDVESFDEYTFLIDEALNFRQFPSNEGQIIFAWIDLSGDPGDLFEFVCDESTDGSTIENFFRTALQCQFERKFGQTSKSATDKDLAQFMHDGRTESPPSPKVVSRKSSIVATPLPATPEKRRDISPVINAQPPATPGTVSHAMPDAYSVKSVLGSDTAELHVFDANTGTFLLQEEEIVATVQDLGGWKYWLDISTSVKGWLGFVITPEVNPVFNYEQRCFIFNYFSVDGSASSWLLRFKDADVLEHFQEILMRSLWETLNQQSWIKATDTERDYVLDAFNNLTLEPTPEDLENLEEEEEEEEEEEKIAEQAKDEVQAKEFYDEDEEYEDELGNGNFSGEGKNSQVAVGYKHDRSFVVRGNKVGVFKHTPNNLEFSTTIENLRTPNGKTFSPSKVMLHAEDSTMILQDPNNKHSLFNMDLEYGKIVDEWKIDDEVEITSFTPSKKFSQMTSEPTFVGISDNSLFRVDPRLSQSKLVSSEHQSYATKNAFSTVATSDQGYLAVASAKGDIRLYDRLGIRAKTQLPALGEPIIGLDVSADGHWILATCKTYLLLIDATIKEGKYAGQLGFQRSFGKDNKPRPKCLQLSPEHVAQMQAETRQALSFTQGHFNTGLNSKETTIVSSSGPYVITWGLKQILKGDKSSYTIRRYGDKVAADNFKFGSDKNVIVVLPDDVGMVSKKSFRKPTRESIATPVRTFGR
ncbi:VID27 cytoplasmic protein-domain-containing protein [Lipomyces oligophaga]|uniref:VID27 cytoplasmic protein-domain-containing protein n=1 Tax=Lipomyces oligophaga TaxID=45792 RepID=UPI0034CE3AA1